MESVTSTFKEGLILFYTLVALQKLLNAIKLPFLLCQDFIPAFLYPVAKMFPNISGWKKMRTQCEEMSDFIREVAPDCKHALSDYKKENLSVT